MEECSVGSECPAIHLQWTGVQGRRGERWREGAERGEFKAFSSALASSVNVHLHTLSTEHSLAAL